MKQLYCGDCSCYTEHREKMDAFKDGNMVCNECDSMNPLCRLTKDSGEEHFSLEVKWIEYDKEGRGKELHSEPAVGRALIMSPFNSFFTWMTTPVVEIVEHGEGYIKFKTENSNYELYTSVLPSPGGDAKITDGT